MFNNDIVIKGKHGTWMKLLAGQNSAKSPITVFKRNLDLLMIAPLVGVIYNKPVEEDNSDDKATVLLAQVVGEKENLELIHRIVILKDNSKGKTNDEKVDLAFRHDSDMDLFMRYVRGGIEYIYEYLNESTTTRDDCYEKLKNLLGDIKSYIQ